MRLFRMSARNGLSRVAAAIGLSAVGALAGCGGAQDYSSFNRNTSGDIGSGYNSALNPGKQEFLNVTGLGTYPMIETSFQLPGLQGDPYDYQQVDVQVALKRPDNGIVSVPCFFDGGTTWRMRYTPSTAGAYSLVSVRLNREPAHAEKIEKSTWNVTGEPEPGFVRLDRGDRRRFIMDNGERYFPIGHNVAWRTEGQADYSDIFSKMHAAGENWSRVWMTHWDGKDLDWPASGKPEKLGQIDLAAAKRWDGIVSAADKSGIHFQLVLQHHGQYSTTTDSNWDRNPYNVKNGGFLAHPGDFFTNPRARELTKRKLYYMLARWGYSPSIMAFELFNEVESTDAAHNGNWTDIAMWHREMVLFLRQYDGYRHLVTTSAAPGTPLESHVWETVDYVQQHSYPTDMVSGVAAQDVEHGKRIDKAVFLGEFGSKDLIDPDGVKLHTGIWAGAMQSGSGGAEYWDWVNVEKQHLYHHFRPLVGFISASGVGNHGDLVGLALPVETNARADLRFAPGGGWSQESESDFIVGTNGAPPAFSSFPAFLQGNTHRAMTPKPLVLHVNYEQAGTFTLRVPKVAHAGAHVHITMDDRAVDRDYPAHKEDYAPAEADAAIRVPVPLGAHTISVVNTGADWFQIGEMRFSSYAPALASLARVGKDFAAVWLYHRDNVDAPASASLSQVVGTISVPGLKAARYRATWWNTETGTPISSSDVRVGKEKGKGADAPGSAPEVIRLSTPPITRDVALFIARYGTQTVRDTRRERMLREQAQKGGGSGAGRGNQGGFGANGPQGSTSGLPQNGQPQNGVPAGGASQGGSGQNGANGAPTQN